MTAYTVETYAQASGQRRWQMVIVSANINLISQNQLKWGQIGYQADINQQNYVNVQLLSYYCIICMEVQIICHKGIKGTHIFLLLDEQAGTTLIMFIQKTLKLEKQLTISVSQKNWKDVTVSLQKKAKFPVLTVCTVHVS